MKKFRYIFSSHIRMIVRPAITLHCSLRASDAYLRINVHDDVVALIGHLRNRPVLSGYSNAVGIMKASDNQRREAAMFGGIEVVA
jgi:hypothetical protein